MPISVDKDGVHFTAGIQMGSYNQTQQNMKNHIKVQGNRPKQVDISMKMSPYPGAGEYTPNTLKAADKTLGAIESTKHALQVQTEMCEASAFRPSELGHESKPNGSSDPSLLLDNCTLNLYLRPGLDASLKIGRNQSKDTSPNKTAHQSSIQTNGNNN